MKIAVIFTGGTIGSVEEYGSIAPREYGAGRLLESVSRMWIDEEWIYISADPSAQSDKSQEKVSYEICSPMTILSENSTGIVINNIKESVERVLHRSDVDGVIVTHGTDTLVYTAAALGYLFADSTIPIVLVSSNYVLDNPLANGWDNFRYGVALIAHLQMQDRGAADDGSMPGGVYVSYRNDDGVPRIHRGCAVIAHQAYSDAVNSVKNREYGYFEKDGERCRFVRGKGMDAVASGEKSESYPALRSPVTRNAPILQIYPYPGMSYPDISNHIKAILHHSYHSGTICTDNDTNAETFFEEAKRRGIPVFLCSAYGHCGESEADDPCGSNEADGQCGKRARYESTKDFDKLGIIVLPAASPVAVYMKLWLLSESGEDILYWMQRSIPGDMDIG